MIKKAIKMLQNSNFEEAEKLLRSIVEKTPDNAEALFHLALARREQNDIWESIELLNQAIKAQPRNATLYFALGNMLLAIEDYDEAESNFLKATGLDPNNVDARNGLAFLEIRQSRFKAAEHSLMIALNIAPENVQSLVFIGIALLEQGQHDEAINYLKKAVTLSPENVQAQFCLGKGLLAAGNSGFAAQCFENAAKGEPQTPEFRDWLACAQLHNGNINDARDNFYKAMEMGRINVEILTGLVKIETMLGHTADALGVMEQAVQLAPERVDLGLQYAEMLMESGQLDGAISQLYSLQASGHEPEMVAVRLATALMKKGDSEQALRVLEPLKTNIDLSPQTGLMLTWALQECGDDEAAAVQLEALLSQETPLLDAVLYRARQMYDASDDQGIELLRQALKREDITARHAQQAQLLLAHSLDRAGQYADAAMEYRGLASRECVVLKLIQQLSQGPDSAESPSSAIDKAVTANWPVQAVDDGRSAPAFIFAWPGSGRGRLLAALAQHSGIQQLTGDPEVQNRRRARLTDRMGANALGQLDDTNIRMSRRHYWQSAGYDGRKAKTTNILDTQWLSTEMLPTIARYFPAATVFVLQRDPRDMAVAWMQSGYQDIDAMASAYQSQLAQLDKCRASLPLNFIDLNYDDICTDSEKALQAVMAALDIEPEAAVTEHFDAATTRIPANSGEWKHYEKELTTVFDVFG